MTKKILIIFPNKYLISQRGYFFFLVYLIELYNVIA